MNRMARAMLKVALAVATACIALNCPQVKWS